MVPYPATSSIQYSKAGVNRSKLIYFNRPYKSYELHKSKTQTHILYHLPLPPLLYCTCFVALPNSTALTLWAKRREQRLSLLLSKVGLKLTNINALPSPLRQSWRRYVSLELRKGICFDPLASEVNTSPNELKLLLIA